MALFSRREKPPASVSARVEPGERILSWADTDDGETIIATTFGLWWPAPQGPRRMAWQHIDKVVWRDDVLTVIEADVVDDMLLVERPAVSATIATPRDLPPVVRKRVEANVAKIELVRVGGGAVRFVARRLPGHDGLTWWARLEPGTPDGAHVRSAISARLAVLRAASDAARHA